MKKKHIPLILLLFLLAFPFIAPQAPESKDVDNAKQIITGKLKIKQIKDTIAFYTDLINALTQPTEITQIQERIDQINADIKKIKDQFNISAIEQQIDQFREQIDSQAASIYAKAYSEKDKINLYNKIFNVIKTIFSNQTIKGYIVNIQRLQRELSQRIVKQVDQIRQIGLTIDLLTFAAEQKQIDQILSQLYPLQSQLIAAKMPKEVTEKLFPLEVELIKLNNEIADKIANLPSSTRQEIRNYKTAIKQLQLMIMLIRNPRKTARITADDIFLVDQATIETPINDDLLTMGPGGYVLYALENRIDGYNENINDIIAQTFGVQDILDKITQTQTKINEIKDKYNITPLESQITQLTKQIDTIGAQIYTKAINPQDQSNYYAKINDIIYQQIYVDDLIKDKVHTIQELQRKIVDEIRNQTAQIQQAGTTIDAQTVMQEQKMIDDLLLKILPLQAQLITAQQPKEVTEKLDPLIAQKSRLDYELLSQIAKLPPNVADKIRIYKDEIKRNQLMLEFLRNPRKAATTTEDEIALFEDTISKP